MLSLLKHNHVDLIRIKLEKLSRYHQEACLWFSWYHVSQTKPFNIYYMYTGTNTLTGYEAGRRTGERPEYENVPFVMVIR